MLDKVNVVMDCNRTIMIHHSSIFIFTTFLDIEIIQALQNFTDQKSASPSTNIIQKQVLITINTKQINFKYLNSPERQVDELCLQLLLQSFAFFYQILNPTRSTGLPTQQRAQSKKQHLQHQGSGLLRGNSALI